MRAGARRRGLRGPDGIDKEAIRLEALGARRIRRYDEVGTSWIPMNDRERGHELVAVARPRVWRYRAAERGERYHVRSDSIPSL